MTNKRYKKQSRMTKRSKCYQGEIFFYQWEKLVIRVKFLFVGGRFSSWGEILLLSIGKKNASG